MCTVRGCDDKSLQGLWKCVKFNEYGDKWSVVRKSRYCYKCLNFEHVRAECKSKYCCQVCQSYDHHHLLCINDKSGYNNDTEKSIAESVNVKIYNAFLNKERKILPFISVNVGYSLLL